MGGRARALNKLGDQASAYVFGQSDYIPAPTEAVYDIATIPFRAADTISNYAKTVLPIAGAVSLATGRPEIATAVGGAAGLSLVTQPVEKALNELGFSREAAQANDAALGYGPLATKTKAQQPFDYRNNNIRTVYYASMDSSRNY